MKVFSVKNQNGEEICKKCILAETFFDRAKGLMFGDTLPLGSDGMIINPCNSIHTFFMKFNLHIIFLNSENKVVKVIKNLPPWRITRIYFSAKKVLEIKSEKNINLSEGDVLEVICIK